MHVNYFIRANLSNDYFTNRQDRYFLIEDCGELCDFYHKLIEKVAEFSFVLQPNGDTSLNLAANYHPYKGSHRIFTKEAAFRIQTLFQDEIEKRANLNKTGMNLIILYGFIQIKHLKLFNWIKCTVHRRQYID